jgi:hypothetical protein
MLDGKKRDLVNPNTAIEKMVAVLDSLLKKYC